MKNIIGNTTDVTPSAVPTEEGIREWEKLPRDEQLRRLRQALSDADCDVVTPVSMDDILVKARARTSSSNRG